MNSERLIFSFSGGAGLFALLMGAGAELHQLLKIWAPEKDIVYAGVSAGCLPALLLALGYTTPEQMTAVFHDFANRFDSADKRPGASELFRQWRLYLMAMLTPEDKWKTLSRRLFIGVSVWNNASRELEPRVISQFESAEAVAEAVLTSAHLFILGLWPTRSFKGQYAADGGWTMRYVELPARYGTTIPVCYDAVADHIEHLDRAVDFSTAKYKELFRLGQKMVRQQQHVYLTLVWFGKADVVNEDDDEKGDDEQPRGGHHHHHHNEPLVPKLDAVSLSLIGGIAATAVAGTLVLAGKSVKQLGAGVARFVGDVFGARSDDVKGTGPLVSQNHVPVVRLLSASSPLAVRPL